MDKIKTLSWVLLLIASTGFIFGSVGYTGVSAEQGISLQVVNDEPYVGYQSTDHHVQDGDTIDLVTITNRASDNIDVTDITVKDGNFTITDPTVPTEISSGEDGTIRGTVACTPNENQAIKLAVTIKGSEVTTHLAGNTATRTFTITCASGKEKT